MAQIEQGEDKELTFTLTDCDDVPILYADLERVIVVIRSNHTPYYWFSSIATPGYGEVKAGTETNECYISLSSEQTKVLPLGKLVAELTLYHTDADYPDGRKETTVIEVGDIEFSQFPNIPNLPLPY